MKHYKLGDTIFCVCGYVIMIVTFISNPFNFDSNLPLDARAGVLKKRNFEIFKKL